MKKRALSLLLALALVFGLLPVAVYAEQLSMGLMYEIYEDHIEITNGEYYATEFVIPAEIEGLPVTSIRAQAFSASPRLTHVDIPDSVTSIGGYAFWDCSALAWIDLPDGITAIADYTFWNCDSLTGIDIPDWADSIGNRAFESCDLLTSVTFPDKITCIKANAFAGCFNLSSICFRGDAPKIYDGVFEGVTATAYYPADNATWTAEVMQNYGGSITWKEIRSAVTGSGLVYEAYADHVIITGYTGNASKVDIPAMIEGLPVTIIGDGAFFLCNNLTSITIPSGVTAIGDYAFSYCDNLTGISIPDGVTFIGDYAFNYCYGLTSIDVPDSVAYIGDAAFRDCINLTGIDLPDGIAYIDNGTFGWCSSMTHISIPDHVTSIGDGAFRVCTSLTSIDLPDSATYIGDYAFSGCYGLTGISIPEQVCCIGKEAFGECYGLTSVDLPDSVTYIGAGAFWDCPSLTSITIPEGVAYIGESAFYICTDLNTIYFEGNAPKFGEYAFYNVTATAYYPAKNPTWTAEVMQNYGGNITWIPYTPNPFTDVPAGSFYEAPVLWALENGITTGATADTFNPDGQCLRAQVVTFLHRAAGNPEPTATRNPFTDVKSSDFFYKPVLWAVEKGITNGTSATTFGSYNVCNRAAVVTFLWRAAGSPEPESSNNPFTDVKSTDFFYKPVLWAIENGITNGISATEFGPTANCNRAQVVTFLYRAYN